jgi:hypothetical protein
MSSLSSGILQARLAREDEERLKKLSCGGKRW